MSPLLYRLSYRAAIGATLAPGPGVEDPFAGRSGTLRVAMFQIAGILGQTPSSWGQTIALLLTFLGIGVIANVLIVYIVAQVLAERRENQERRQPDV